MPDGRHALDIGVLESYEPMFRERLRQAPEDVEARSKLAWCLFVQAVHRAGQEQAVLSLGGDGCTRGPDGRNSVQILRDSLRQAVAVSQLSVDERRQIDSDTLQQVVLLSGGSEAVVRAREEADQIVQDISRGIRGAVAGADRRTTSSIGRRRRIYRLRRARRTL